MLQRIVHRWRLSNELAFRWRHDHGGHGGRGTLRGGTTGNVKFGVDQHVVASSPTSSTVLILRRAFSTGAANAAQGNAINTRRELCQQYLPAFGGRHTQGYFGGTDATFSGTATAGQVNAVGSYLLEGCPC